jgi:hypothetical protein
MPGRRIHFRDTEHSIPRFSEVIGSKRFVIRPHIQRTRADRCGDLIRFNLDVLAFTRIAELVTVE